MISHSSPTIDTHDIFACEKLIGTKRLARGEMVSIFEKNLKEYIGTSLFFTFSSGTSALVAALRLLSLGAEDEVIIPSYVCDSVLKAIKFIGAKPVICDIDTDWVSSYKTVNSKRTSKTKAIIAVHTFGITCDLTQFEEEGLCVIEDACQSFGGMRNGKKHGSLTSMGVFSFHATKCLTTGEGGALSINDSFLQKTKISRENLITKITEMTLVSPLSDLQAALGVSQLKKYPQLMARRQQLANFYYKNFQPHHSRVVSGLQDKSIFFRFPLLTDLNFEDVRSQFEKKGIQVRHGVDALIHRSLGLPELDYQNAINAYKHTISIPLYPSLSDDEAAFIADAVNEIL